MGDRSVAKNTLIAIMHGPYEPWEQIATKGQAVTWIPRSEELGVSTLYVHGKTAPQSLQLVDSWHESWRWSRLGHGYASRALIVLDRALGRPFRDRLPAYSLGHTGHLPSDCLLVNVSDMYLTQRWKDLALFDYFIRETNFNFLYMTTTSSYVDVMGLLRHLQDSPREGVYAGPIMGSGRHEFVSGASRILTRDVVQVALQNRNRWDSGRLEDHALGLVLRGEGVSLTVVPSLNLSSLDEIRQLPLLDPGVPFHFRLKSGPLYRRGDVQLMKALHERLAAV